MQNNGVMNWKNGTLKLADKTDNDKVKLIIGSDWGPRGVHRESMLKNGKDYYGDLLPVLQEADLRIVNVELVLGEAGEPIVKDGPNLRAGAEYIGLITLVPFEIACLANNHIKDYGIEGLTETISLLQKQGIRTLGAHPDVEHIYDPLEIEIDSTKIGLLNVGEGEESKSTKTTGGVAYFDKEIVTQKIKELKEKVDICLVICHAGREHVSVPPPFIHDLYHDFVDAGADAVVGHHPHVPQGMELYSGKPIFYSLGNFAFYQEGVYYQSIGFLLELTLEPNGIAECQIIPYKIETEGLRLLRDDERIGLFSALEKASQPLKSSADVQQVWEAFANRWGNQAMLERLEGIIAEFNQDPVKAAARLRNGFDTPSHRELYLTALAQKMAGKGKQNYPKWAEELIDEWQRGK